MLSNNCPFYPFLSFLLYFSFLGNSVSSYFVLETNHSMSQNLALMHLSSKRINEICYHIYVHRTR